MDHDRRPVLRLLSGVKCLVRRLSSILTAVTGPLSGMPGNIEVNRVVGNFLTGDFFGDVECRHGHPVRLFNIGRGHFVACDSCRTFLHVGSNLMSNWREETEDIWRRNSQSISGYRFIEW